MSNPNEPRTFLSLRENWRAETSKRGAVSEDAFHDVMQEIFNAKESMHYKIEKKPKDLKQIYNGRRGILPDFAVRNELTGRSVYVEIKRQRPKGNAHERACKYFAPGIIVAGREHGKISDSTLPFFWIFTNGLATDERYRSAIAFWFSTPEAEKHFLLWDLDREKLLDFFLENIRPVID